MNIYICIYMHIYICLKTTLKSNQTSGRSDHALLEKLKRKHVWKTWVCLLSLCLHLAVIFVTSQHNVFSNTVRSLLMHEIQCLNLTCKLYIINSFDRSIFWTNNFSPKFSFIFAELATPRTNSFWKLVFSKV